VDEDVAPAVALEHERYGPADVIRVDKQLVIPPGTRTMRRSATRKQCAGELSRAG